MQIPQHKNGITVSTDLSGDSKQWKSAPFPRMLLVNQCVCVHARVCVCVFERSQEGGWAGIRVTGRL